MQFIIFLLSKIFDYSRSKELSLAQTIDQTIISWMSRQADKSSRNLYDLARDIFVDTQLAGETIGTDRVTFPKGWWRHVGEKKERETLWQSLILLT